MVRSKQFSKDFLVLLTSVQAMLVYAVVVTIIAVWATIKIGQAAEKVKK